MESKKENIEIKKEEAMYRGHPISYLKTLDVRESAKFMSSASRRHIIRNFDTIEKFLKRCEGKIAKKKRIQTHRRDIVIVPRFVGLTIGIHNGKSFINVEIIPEMIGHRLGEFALTRTKVKHGGAGIGATKGSKTLKK